MVFRFLFRPVRLASAVFDFEVRFSLFTFCACLSVGSDFGPHPTFLVSLVQQPVLFGYPSIVMMTNILYIVLISWGRVLIFWESHGFLSIFVILGPIHLSCLDGILLDLSEIISLCLSRSTFLSEFLIKFFVLSSRFFASSVSSLAWCLLGRCSFFKRSFLFLFLFLFSFPLLLLFLFSFPRSRFLSLLTCVTSIPSGTLISARSGLASDGLCLAMLRWRCSQSWLSLKKTWVGPVLLSFGMLPAPFLPIS